MSELPFNIDEQIKLCEAATPGPWIPDQERGGHIRAEVYRGRECLVDKHIRDDRGAFPSLCQAIEWPDSRWDFLHEPEMRANQRLIASARTVLPEALRRLKAAQEAAEEYHIAQPGGLEAGEWWQKLVAALGID